MLSLQLARLLSCKLCPIPPKLGPSLGFRPLRQVGFGSLWRNQTQYGCLMARSSTSVDGGSSKQELSSDVVNEEEEERDLPLGPQGLHMGVNAIPPYEIGKSKVSESKQENVGDIIKNQPLDNQLQEIIAELRKNNEIIKRLQETMQKAEQHALEINRTEARHSTAVRTEVQKRPMEKAENKKTGKHKAEKSENGSSKKQKPDSSAFGRF